ncbi:MAG TPA: tRNA (guanine(37)-N(1))-methyltransferase [Anaerolineales bacterium]
MSTGLRFDVFTLFPEVFEPYLQTSILQRARQNRLVEVHLHNIRDWTYDRHHITDDEPYGGGGGMVMKPEPIFAAVEAVLGAPVCCPLILLTPQGRTFTQKIAQELAAQAFSQVPHPSQPPPAAVQQGQSNPASSSGEQGPETQDDPLQPRLALLCGRYEGVDERVRQHLVTDQISIGDYVITGGELAALVVIDAVTRLIPGALGDPDGPWDDSHASGLLEYPHYTRPPEFRGWRVPDVLLSGDHGKIARWRREQSLLRTWQHRPDLVATAPLSEADRKFLERLRVENETTEG